MDTQRNEQNTSPGVAIVGGGIAGLIAAVKLARAGRAVRLFERSRECGGRAVTQVHDGYHLNLGPHALYRGGAASRILRELRLALPGHVPFQRGWILSGDRLHRLPSGGMSLLVTRALSLRAKLDFIRLSAGLQRIDAQRHDGQSLAIWLAEAVRTPELRRFFQMIARLITYANEPERLSAGAMLAQLQLTMHPRHGGVLYLDGGWQAIVDALRQAALTSGVEIVAGARVERVEHAAGLVRGVVTADGRGWSADAVLLALPADAAAKLLTASSLSSLLPASEIEPVRAASLDVALRKVPRPDRTFCLCLDRPLYYSLHSATARLAPSGGGVLHVLKYSGHEHSASANDVRAELEALLDRMQPGWRAHVVEARFLPAMTPASMLDRADRQGLAGRPGIRHPGIHGLLLAGDWIGSEGLLVDASAASAAAAAEALLHGTAKPALRPIIEQVACG